MHCGTHTPFTLVRVADTQAVLRAAHELRMAFPHPGFSGNFLQEEHGVRCVRVRSLCSCAPAGVCVCVCRETFIGLQPADMQTVLWCILVDPQGAYGGQYPP